MIQRIQTIYLLLIACLMSVVVFVPVAGTLSEIGEWCLLGVSAITAILSCIAIFLYKNRKRQIRFCRLITGLLVVFYLVLFLSNLSFPLNLSFLQDYGFQYTVCFPLIALLFGFLAIKGIKKDEKLVRSADRLR